MRWILLFCGAGAAALVSGCGETSSTSSNTTSSSSGGSGGGGAGGTGATGGQTTTSTGGSTGGTGGSACVVDGTKSDTEICDDGNMVDGDGCDNDCTYSCADPAVDCPPAPCNVVECTMQHTCNVKVDPTQDGMPCPGGTCFDGACDMFTCGDGVPGPGEECDFGAGNGPGTGCETNCVFSCSTMPDSCNDIDLCDGIALCTEVMVNGKVGQKCVSSAPAPDCTPCDTGICKNQVCAASVCSDGCVDPVAGEECEPPGSMTCNAMCKKITPSGCGDGVRAGAEQCDDGNNVNLDGCDSTCLFEQNQRTNDIQMQFSTDPFCGGFNQLGSAIATIGQGTFQQAVDQAVTAGAAGILFKVMGLDDLTGQNDGAVALGIVGGAPVAGAAYNGKSDLDWWYTASNTWLDAQRNPIESLGASIVAGLLDAGPATLTVPNFFAASPPSLNLSGVRLQIQIGAVNTPLTSMGNPPGHLAAEHLNPALQSFAGAGNAGNNLGKLCADVSAASLDLGAIPPELLSGQTACGEGYTAQNSLLDLLVGGCTVLGVVKVVNPTQPDKVNPAVPMAGAGGPYTLTQDAQKNVNGCKDKNGATADLPTCLTAAAYSSFFRVRFGRVIIK
ncbi:MAG: DUF4215 domain-containing protein [Polyangiaceae bacterium]|nr:DUF4215 domain-containing protein [Polyangiaceae bacterium]